MDININGVNITLTKEQLKEIDKQLKKVKTINDINSLEDAEEILENTNFHTKYIQSQFTRIKDWNNYKLETIIKATNYLDNNNKEWIANFDNNNEIKYLPYLQKSGSGWFLFYVVRCCSDAYCSVWFYFKKEQSTKIITNKFIGLYNKVLG